MIIWLLFLSLTTVAQDNAIEEYCFSSPGKMEQVLNKTRFILVPADKIQTDRSCFTVNTPSHRRELIQNYVKRIDSNVSISFSSAELRREHCRIKVEKIKNLKRDTTSGELNTNQTFGASAEQQRGETKDVASIQTMKEFELTVNQDSILGECRAITPDRYEITIQVKKEARPLLPPVPPGTVVIVPDAKIPPPQETSNLTTTVQLNRGQKLELSGVLKDLKNSAQKADLNSGVGLENTEGAETEKVFLLIE
jgi:hypothetical protein